MNKFVIKDTAAALYLCKAIRFDLRYSFTADPTAAIKFYSEEAAKDVIHVQDLNQCSVVPYNHSLTK